MRDWRGRAAILAAALAVLFLALHLPFLPASLEDLDSINFALGLRRFDVAHHQPHPPGYPVFIALGKAVHAAIPSETRALALVGLTAAALAAFALVRLFERIDDGPQGPTRAALATIVALTSPLYWFTAARPLSDATGLAAAIAVQALTLTAASDRALAMAAFCAACAAGLRSQAVWLTVPLLVWRVWRTSRPARARTAVTTAAAFAVGGLAWTVPLVLLSGGPAAYLRAVAHQGAEDLSGIQMLWTTPTAREVAVALYYAFVAPWALTSMAIVVLMCALIGAMHLGRTQPATLGVLAIAFVPYFLFDLLFQETFTVRYALPNLVPVAYLAVCGALVAQRLGVAGVVAVAVANLTIAQLDLARYARAPAPAFRLLADMREAQRHAGTGPVVVGMDRRESLDLRRPLQWAGDDQPQWAMRLPSPPKTEWQQVVDYWTRGGRDIVWYIADPARAEFARADLPLVDPFVRRDRRTYRWDVSHHVLLDGVRPDVMDWYVMPPPGWFLDRGWALTPATAGYADVHGLGPDRAPIGGWVRRRDGPATLLVGGRNFATDGRSSRVTVALDGREISSVDAAPGFFMRLLPLGAGVLAGAGDYGRLTVSSSAGVRLGVEQFDLQPPDRVVFGFADGWLEQEYQPSSDLQWRWMSERAELRVRGTGRPLTLALAGESPRTYFSKPSRLVIRAGDRVAFDDRLSSDFSLRVTLPAEVVAAAGGAITLETDQTFVPAERSRRSTDRRHLGLRIFTCDVRPAS